MATTDFDFSEFTPVEEESFNFSDFQPVARQSGNALRERLRFNLENDYADDQGSLFDQALIGAAQGFAGLAGAAGGVASFVGANETGKRLSDYAAGKRAEYEGLGDILGTSPSAQITRNISGQIAQQAPLIAAGYLSGGSIPVMAGIAGVQSLGQIEDEAIQAYEARGFTRDEAVSKARGPAALGGAITAALTRYFPGGTEALLKRFMSGEITRNGVRAAVKEAGRQALLEYPEEALDELAQGMIAKYTYDPDKPWGEIFQEAHDAGALGTLVSGGVGAFPVAGAAYRNIRPQEASSMLTPDDEYLRAREAMQFRGAAVPDIAQPVIDVESVSTPEPAPAPISAEEFTPIEEPEPDLPSVPALDPANEEIGLRMLRGLLGEEDVAPVAASEFIPVPEPTPETIPPIPETIAAVPKPVAPPIETTPPIVETFDWEASTPTEGVRISGEYDVIDAADLVTSFDKGYDQALQPRDRSRAASQQQIVTISQNLDPNRLGESPTTDMGAPIIDERNQVLSGNGRTASLRNAYGTGKADAYRQFVLDNAARFGVDPEAVAGMTAPVLVRRVGDLGGISKEEFTRQSNRQQVLGVGESEAAAADARMLLENPDLLDRFSPTEGGDILGASNRDFLNRFIEGTGDQASLMGKDGYNVSALQKRVKNAILGALVGPEKRQMITALLERAEELGIQNVTSGLVAIAPRLLKLRSTPYDLAQIISKATQDLIRLKSEGGKIEDFLAQTDLFGDPDRTAESDYVLQKLFESKSIKAVADPLARYVEMARRIDTTTSDMFGTPPASRMDLLKASYGTTEAIQSQENLALGEPPTSETKAKPKARRSNRGVRGEQGAVLENQPPAPEQQRPTATARGNAGIRALIEQSPLPEDTKFVAGKVLDVVESTGLNMDAMAIALSDALSDRRAGSISSIPSGPDSPITTLIRMVNTADATILPHEVAHLLETLMPESDLAAIDQARVANLPENAPDSIRSGTMTSQEFVDSGLPIDLYPFINRSEYLARFFSEKFASDQLAQRDAGLLKRIQLWLKKLWEAIRSKFKDPEAMDRIYSDLVSGKYKANPQTAIKIEQERAGFQITAEGARNEAELARDQAEEKISGEDFLAQSDAPVKIMEKFGVNTMPNSVRRSFFYNDLKGIQQQGEALNQGPDNYQSIRQRSDPAQKDRRAGMAAQHAIRFDSNLNDVIAEAQLATQELASTPVQRRVRKLQSAFLSALFYEQAFKNAQTAVQSGLNQAFSLLKKENRNDLKVAQLEGQIRALQNTQKSRVALERVMQDMVRLFNQQTTGLSGFNMSSRDIATAYKRLAGDNALASDDLIGVAAYILNRIPEVRDQILAAQLSQNTATLQQAQSAMMGLLTRLKNDPAPTLERIMRERERRAGLAKGSEFLFLHLQKELSKELETLYARIQAGQIARNIQADPEWTDYRDQVLRDQGSYGGKPIEPFKGANEVLTLPDGTTVGIGSHRIVDSTAETRKSLEEISLAMDKLRVWLDDPANIDNPTYARRQLDLETLETYYNLFLLQSGQKERLKAPLLGSAMSILNLVVDDSGSRHAPAVKSAIGLIDRIHEKVPPWLRQATITLSGTQRAAMKAHGFTGDTFNASLAYDQDVFQELANSHQRQQGGLKVGDKLMSGLTVKQEDIDHLAAMSQSGKDLLEIVKRYDRVVLADERGLKKGETNYRTELASSKFIVPRRARSDLAQSPNVRATADSFTRYSQEPTTQNLTDLNDAFSRLWEGVGKYFVSERNPEFAQVTVFDGKGGAFSLVADEIRNNPNAYPTFDSLIDRLSQLSTLNPDDVRVILLNEFGRIVNLWYQQTARDEEAMRVSGGDPTNSFTTARGNQLAPSPFYRTGFENSDAVRSHAAAATSVPMKRVEDGLKIIQSDLRGQIEALKVRTQELRSQGVQNAEQAAVDAKKLEQANGRAYASWERLEARLTRVTNAINRLSNAPIERSEWDKVWSRVAGGVVGSLIGNSITTLRNTSPIYMVRALKKAGYSDLSSWLLGFGFSQWQAAKIIISGGVAIPHAGLAAIKGMSDAILNVNKDRSFRDAWRRMMKPVLHALGTSAPERIQAYQEMKAAGIYQVPDAQQEFDNRMADMLYRGEIPSAAFTPAQKAMVAATALFENTVGAVANAIFPTIGDVGINSSMWTFENSRFGHSAVFGKKIRGLFNDWQNSQYRPFDFANPNNPINILSSEELHVTPREMADLRRTFTSIGTSFDAKVVEYMARLANDPNAEFLNADEKGALVEFLINTANRGTVGNRPMFFRNNPKIETFMAPLLNWPIRQLAEWSASIAVPAEANRPIASKEELNRSRMAAWTYTGLLAILGMAIPGALSQLRDEEIARIMKRYLYNQVSQNKHPWEHEQLSDRVGNWSRLTMESVPLMAIAANLALPQNTPARAAYEPSLVLLEKVKDANDALTKIVKSGDVVTPVAQFASGMNQDLKIITSRMESQSGNRERGNLIALMKRFGPEDLIQPQINRSGVSPNLSELTPYGPRMWNAAFNENREELQRTFREAVEVAKRLGRTRPEVSVADMFHGGNPASVAFKSLPTFEQYNEMLSKMSVEQRVQFENGKREFEQASAWLGLRVPRFYRDEEEVRPRSVLRSGRLGLRDVRAR